MTGEKLMAKLAALTPEQQRLVVKFEYYTDGTEYASMKNVEEVAAVEVKRRHYGLPEVIMLSS